MTIGRWRRIAFVVLAFALAPVSARETASAAQATFEAQFTPGDSIDVRLADLIDGAEHEVPVNAFSFTHRKIARARGGTGARRARGKSSPTAGKRLARPAAFRCGSTATSPPRTTR